MAYYYTYSHSDTNRRNEEELRKKREKETQNRKLQEERNKREHERREKRKKALDQGTLDKHKEITKSAIDNFPKGKYDVEDIDLLIEIGQEKYSKSVFDTFETQFSNKMAQYLYNKAASRISNEEDPYLIDISLREAKYYSQNKDSIIELENTYQKKRPDIWMKAAQKQVEEGTDTEIIELYMSKAGAFRENEQKIKELDIEYKKRLPKIHLKNAVEFVKNYPTNSDMKKAEKLFTTAEVSPQNKGEIKTLREELLKKRGHHLLNLLQYTVKVKDIQGFNIILDELEKNHRKDVGPEIDKIKANALKIKK